MALTQEEWERWLNEEREKDYYKRILAQLRGVQKTQFISPDEDLIFKCLEIPDIRNVKVVIVGDMPPQDLQNADGLALSCYDNAYADRAQRYFDFALQEFTGQKDVSNKQAWVDNGFMLINYALTRDIHKHGSTHTFWHYFTRSIIKKLFEDSTPRAFIFCRDLGFEPDKRHMIAYINDLQPYENIAIFNKVNLFLIKYYGKSVRWEV